MRDFTRTMVWITENVRCISGTQVQIIFALFLTCSVSYIVAQPGSVIPPNVRAMNTIERLTDSNGLGTNEMMYGIPLPEEKVIGDTYLNTEWKRSVILLYENNKLLEGYPIRYDIKADELGVKTVNGVKVLSGRNVKSFTWIDSLRSEPYYYINAKEYRNDGIALAGFFEVLVDGKTPLFKKMDVIIKKADYNVQLSIGSRDDKILKKPTYYFADVNKTIEVSGNKRKMLTLLEDNTSEVEMYMDKNGLSTKNEDDLIKIFKYYNSLIKD